MAGDLSSVRVRATVPMLDFVSKTAFDVTVDLTWTGTSSLGHQSSPVKVSFQGCHVNLKNNSGFRFAKASGTVSDGTTDFTPARPGWVRLPGQVGLRLISPHWEIM